jgi:hypothetical protein
MCPFVIIFVTILEEIIIFVKGKRFPVKMKVAEQGKYIRDVITNNA